MIGFLSRRVFESALILIGITFITFLLLFVLPADPVRQIAGRSATPEVIANIRHQLGLDLPFYQQYWRYFVNLLQGDFGRSYLQKSEVAELIKARLPASLLLMAAGIFAELLIGLAMGIISSLRRGGKTDNILMVVSFVGVSAPQFAVGILMLYFFAVKLAWFPIGGYGTWQHLVLPALTMGFMGAGWYSRMMRSSMLNVLEQDFIRTAKAKGLGKLKVIMRHAVPNAILPIIAMIGIDIGLFVSGMIVVESVFGWPGIGQLAWQAIQRVDIPIIMGVTLVAAFFIVIGNFIADVISIFVDPRIKLK
ncbi:MAG: ABC transporter permease [Alphaproteobacteria bacterium]|nr:ABC transporter permease [Alphaproteobacteria bacterium]